jgi:hypothetical protein
VYGSGTLRMSDLWVLQPGDGDGKSKTFPFLESPAIETQAQFSPDGRWIAYMTGPIEAPAQRDVLIAPFPGPGRTWRVSQDFGWWPRWRRDGSELFYLAQDNTLMAASISTQGSTLEVGVIRPLFKIRPRPMVRQDAYPFDVSRDGQRFLVNTLVEDVTSTPITLVVNWAHALHSTRLTDTR